MKFVVVAALVGAASAIPALVNTGSSAVSRSDDGCGNYAFGYNEDHATGGTFRKEKGGPGYVSGSYGLRDADGRVRTVNYIADALGYRASVSTNEPGVDVKQDPAAVDLNYGYGYAAPAVLAAPVAAYAAPVVTKAYAAAPVAAYGYANNLYANNGYGYNTGYVSNQVYPSSYSVSTQHASYAPVVAGHGYNTYNSHY